MGASAQSEVRRSDQKRLSAVPFEEEDSLFQRKAQST